VPSTVSSLTFYLLHSVTTAVSYNWLVSPKFAHQYKNGEQIRSQHGYADLTHTHTHTQLFEKNGWGEGKRMT